MSPDARTTFAPTVSHLQPVPDLPPTPLVTCTPGPFLSLTGPRSLSRPAPAGADCLQLRWAETNPDTLQLVPPAPLQPLPGPGMWVLQVPLEPVLLQASAVNALQDLVIDRPEALRSGSLQRSLFSTVATLVDCQARDCRDLPQVTQWL